MGPQRFTRFRTIINTTLYSTYSVLPPLGRISTLLNIRRAWSFHMRTSPFPPSFLPSFLPSFPHVLGKIDARPPQPRRDRRRFDSTVLNDGYNSFLLLPPFLPFLLPFSIPMCAERTRTLVVDWTRTFSPPFRLLLLCQSSSFGMLAGNFLERNILLRKRRG